MQKKGFGILLIVVIVLVVAACGNQGDHEQNTGSASSEPPTLILQPPAYKEMYQNSVFLGDSITEGLSYHDVLNEENVVAGAGKTAEITMIGDDIEHVVERNPEHVFIQLGSTDILWPTEDPKEHSLTHYAKLLESIKIELPKTKITLLSVTPVSSDAEEEEPRYGNIEDYNEGLKELAAKEQIDFVDLTSLVTEHADLYDTDGIHFQAAFYPILLDYLTAVQSDR